MKRQNKILKIIILLLAILSLGSITGLLSDGYSNFNFNTWFKTEEQLFERIEYKMTNEVILSNNGTSTTELEDDEYLPIAYAELDLFENKTITKIGVAVSYIAEVDEDCTMTIYVVDVDDFATTKEYVKKYTLTIKADTYEDNEVEEWVYFDVNIKVEDNQTLVFGDQADTIAFRYIESDDYNYFGSTGFYKNCLTGESTLVDTYYPLFDIYYVK